MTVGETEPNFIAIILDEILLKTSIILPISAFVS